VQRRRCVIVGDVIDSRSRGDRERLEAALSAGLERANEVAESVVAARVVGAAGPEESSGRPGAGSEVSRHDTMGS
jgi:hypothetical protein